MFITMDIWMQMLGDRVTGYVFGYKPYPLDILYDIDDFMIYCSYVF